MCVVVSLLEPEEEAQLNLAGERDAAERNGIHFVSFPVVDRGVPSSIEATLSLLRSITNALKNGKNVAVHCRQGIGLVANLRRCKMTMLSDQRLYSFFAKLLVVLIGGFH